MLSRTREALTLALIGLLPFHALLVTVGTKVLRGAGHAPWGLLAIWKEGLLAVILLITLAEMARNFRRAMKIDSLDLLIAALVVIAVALFFYRPWMTRTGFLFGFKYDFIPLIAFVILRRVPWSQRFWTQAERLLLAVGGVVALYGIATLFLPQSFFSLLGYSDAHSLYLPAKPLAAFQQISGSSIRRIQSTFSGPNQLGLWLLIPLSIAMSFFIQSRTVGSGKWLVVSNEKNRVLPTTHYSLLTSPQFLWVISGLLLFALFLTFSRSAWLGALAILCALGYRSLPRRVFREALVGILSLLMILGVAMSLLVPSLLLRRTSTWGHVVRPLMALHEMRRYPLGMGLGSAGPATNRTHEPCVYLDSGADPSWAKSSPQLCVFVGDLQMQPTDHVCSCAMLPENWYLQIGVEMGVIGLILYLAATVILLKRLFVGTGAVGAVRERPLHAGLVFLAISVAALFLHAWEDSAVAYTAWILAAAALHNIAIRERRA